MNRIALIALTAVVGFVLTACNTIAGAGRDIEKAGEVIQGAARK